MRCVDRVFQPLHRRLATQPLSGFAWLTSDRQVQQTRFADGDRLTVNFSGQPREVEGRPLAARAMRVQLAGELERTVLASDCAPPTTIAGGDAWGDDCRYELNALISFQFWFYAWQGHEWVGWCIGTKTTLSRASHRGWA